MQFYDEAAAQSAMRNLQEVPINGRPVRIELSNDERMSRRPGGPPPQFAGAGAPRRDSPPPIDHGLLPPGTEPGPGQKATDAISKTLAEVNPGQMQEVMAGMKVSASGAGADTRLSSPRSRTRRAACSRLSRS